MARRAVFLDRDGVLNQSTVSNGRPYPPPSVETLVIFDTSVQACKLLAEAGFLLIGVTNQPDIARGKTSKVVIDQINAAVTQATALDDMRVCPHDDADFCGCRKPKPGLLIDAAADFDIDLSSSIMVGDRWKDVDAGIAAGCRTVFIDYGYDEPAPTRVDFVCPSLFDAVPWITGVSPCQ